MVPHLLTSKFIVLLSTLLILSCSNHKNISQLELVNVYEVQTEHSIEASGLTEWDGEFYTVSDKHNAIYHLLFKKNKIVLDPIINISHRDNTKLDFEGITHDDEFFYLISEASFQILKVSKDGIHQKWFPMRRETYDKGKSAGLFQIQNANFEGICILKKNTFLLAAERQPRGFVEYKNNDDVRAYQVDDPVYQYKNNRSPDFAGLSCDDGIYVLDRNAYMVAELKKIDGKYKETKGYSYEHIVTQPQSQFQNMDFGHAEGLVVKGDRVYLILDNNKNPRFINPTNNNSLFFELKK